MSAESTTLTNTANQPLGPKSTKLKSSCDFCALSKVKCDRGQPQCLRCIKSGILCHYSETRRIGKARQIYAASHTRRGSPTMQGTWRSQQSSAHQPQQSMDRAAGGGSRRTPTNQLPMNNQCGSSDYSMPLNMFDNFLSQDSVPKSIAPPPSHPRHARTQPYSRSSDCAVEPLPSPESPGGFLPNLGETVDLEMGDMEYMQELDLEGHQAWDASDSGPSPTDGHAADCIKRAFSVLQTLDVASASCARSDGAPVNPMQSLDATLKNNRMAMDTVREILGCPCSHGMRVALLLVLITHQVMESYRALLTRQQQSGPGSPNERWASESDCSFPARDIPLAIGRYLLDDEMRAKVIVQIIHSELDKMTSLLDIFAQYAKGMSKQPEEAVLGTYIDALRVSRDEVLQSLAK